MWKVGVCIGLGWLLFDDGNKGSSKIRKALEDLVRYGSLWQMWIMKHGPELMKLISQPSPDVLALCSKG